MTGIALGPEMNGAPATRAVRPGRDGREAQGDVVVSVRALGKTYEPTPAWMRLLVRTMIRQPITALQDVNLEVREGGICAVVGPNGAGKTTMFRILVGLTTATTGAATVAGYDVIRESAQVRRLLGWMPSEDRSLFLRLSCWENLYSHGRLHGIPRAELVSRIPQMLEQVGLPGREKVAALGLSSGMRARLQLARALLTRPRLLILDEPTGAVDPVGAHELLGLIADLVVEHRMAALISSHRLEEIEALHSQVVLLDRGRVRFNGDLDALRSRYGRPELEVEFASPDTAGRAATLLAGFADVRLASGAVLRCLPAADVPVGQVLRRLTTVLPDVVHVREVRLPLRDVLAAMYRGDAAQGDV